MWGKMFHFEKKWKNERTEAKIENRFCVRQVTCATQLRFVTLTMANNYAQ